MLSVMLENKPVPISKPCSEAHVDLADSSPLAPPPNQDMNLGATQT